MAGRVERRISVTRRLDGLSEKTAISRNFAQRYWPPRGGEPRKSPLGPARGTRNPPESWIEPRSCAPPPAARACLPPVFPRRRDARGLQGLSPFEPHGKLETAGRGDGVVGDAGGLQAQEAVGKGVVRPVEQIEGLDSQLEAQSLLERNGFRQGGI